MVGKQLQPPSSTSYVTTGSGYTTPEQVVIEGKRTVKVQKRGNEWESDSEYVSTTEATQTNVGGSTITNIPTTESQLPPSIQELLTPTTQGGTSSSVQQTISTSTVTSRQYRTEPNTTVTHTTITFSEPESNVTTGTTETTTKPQVGQQPQTTPRQAPKMVVPNINAPVQSPLLLRVSPVHDAVVAHVDSDRLSTPKERVELWQAETRHSALYRLAPSAEVPPHCTFIMPPHVANVATIQHIINTPVSNVTAFCLPPLQKVKKEHISRRLGCAHLMLAPEGPLQAEKLRPFWETVTFTIAFGKHVAIEYRIPKLAALKVELVKCQKYPIVKVDSKVLYRKVAEEKVVHWTAAKPYQIILTTVEKDDPQMVKRVRLEQNPLYERMPSQCNVAEVDMYTTEQVDYKTHSTTGEQSRTERHTYHDHQLIQRWKNTIHVENRRQRIDW
ncbi:hypothetical protein V3C99_002507 [Haemonchus contortus]|uniref:DM5 domain-containing protein n=1 Tax=Haemonchus contortus TaxID=6289 RepID=A0A7I4YBY7_HAECO|nr:Protein C18E3.1 [Haemonchus contortus]